MAAQKDFGPVSGPASPAFDPNTAEFDTAAGLPALGKAEGKLPGALRRPLTARIIALILVLAAVVGLGGGKLAAKAADVRALYEQGMRGDGLSIASDLNARANAAANILAMAESLLGQDDALVTEARAALDGLNAAEGPAAQYQANARLASAVDALYQQLVPLAEKEGKADTLQTQWSEFLSRQDIIQHDGYNEAAQAFNETLGGFPAVLLGGIWQIEKVELFA